MNIKFEEIIQVAKRSQNKETPTGQRVSEDPARKHCSLSEEAEGAPVESDVF
jgi:hypothetical protein